MKQSIFTPFFNWIGYYLGLPVCEIAPFFWKYSFWKKIIAANPYKVCGLYFWDLFGELDHGACYANNMYLGTVLTSTRTPSILYSVLNIKFHSTLKTHLGLAV